MELSSFYESGSTRRGTARQGRYTKQMGISTPFYVDADQIGFLLKQVKEQSFEYP
jgi:hypothetical protein